MEKNNQAEIEAVINDVNYLFSQINWPESFLDATSVTIMNELSGRIRKLGESAPPEETKDIEIDLSEQELEELLHEGKVFDWRFKGVDVHIKKEEDEIF